MKLYRSRAGIIAENAGRFYELNALSWDELVTREDLLGYLTNLIRDMKTLNAAPRELLPPIGSQEVWAAGVTYYRSRDARMEESKSAGGGDFYDRVYHASRPELFFKSTPHRVVGPDAKVAIRDDASWSVPEPELTLFVTPRGQIAGYTIGNDMSSRDIEGANPLYLPQAKVYDRSCALGPGILLRNTALPITTAIGLRILRSNQTVFSGTTTLAELRREPETLVEYLFRDQTFPHGCFLLTGTGIVPPDSFTLHVNDEIHISIEGIGTLINTVE